MSVASFHMRSSPGIKAATTLGAVKLSPRLLECVAVTRGAKVRLVRGTLGTLELLGSGAFMAISASPPPDVRRDRRAGRRTLRSGWSLCQEGVSGSEASDANCDSCQRRENQRDTPPMLCHHLSSDLLLACASSSLLTPAMGDRLRSYA